MMRTFAFEIAAAFLLAAILMGGTFLRGFFSQELLRVFKLAALSLILAGVGLWIYSVYSIEPVAPPAQAVNPSLDPVKKAQQAKRAAAVRDSDRKALAKAITEEAAKPDTPAHIVVGEASQAIPEKRGSKIVKSVGRALHVIPKN